MKEKKLYTISQGIEYAMGYCAKEERCQKDVKDKLMYYGLSSSDADYVVIEMITKNFLSEQRYSNLYVRSKINQNYWGKTKIRYMLSLKNISKTCIDKAISLVDEQRYKEVVGLLAEKKLKTIHTTNSYEKRQKVYQYLVSHGFENEIINNVLSEKGL